MEYLITHVQPELFSTRELQMLVRRMIVLNQKQGHDLTASFGGIDLRWTVSIADDAKTLYCELHGPDWVMHATMGQDNAIMQFESDISVMGNRIRFETDIIFLKLALS